MHGSPTDGADRVVTTSNCNLFKKNYFVACSGHEILIFIRDNSFHLITITLHIDLYILLLRLDF